MSVKVGRNAPCPCGSGRKYKSCCLNEAVESLGRVAFFQAMDRRLVSQVLGFALEWFGVEFEATEEFEESIKPRGDELSLFGHWAVFVHVTAGHTPLEWFLGERGDSLASAERVWLNHQAEAWFSIWAVQEETGPHTFRMQDLMTGREHLVTMETDAGLAPGVALLGRVMAHGDLALFAGMHPRTLKGPALAEAVLHLRQSIGGGPGPVLPERLRTEEATGQLIISWSDLVEQGDHGTPDGSVAGVMLCTDQYLSCAEVRDDDAIAAALDSLPGVDRTVEDDPGTTGWEVPDDSDDSDDLDDRPWRRAATMELNNTGLVVLGDSETTMDRLRVEIERVAGSLLRHERRSIVRRADLMRMEAKSPSSRYDDDDDPGETREPWSPIEAAAFRSLKEKYYAAWPDTPQPFLDGRTPKAAMAIPRFRRHIRNILNDMEEREFAVGEGFRVGLLGLRRALDDAEQGSAEDLPA